MNFEMRGVNQISFIFNWFFCVYVGGKYLDIKEESYWVEGKEV